MLAARRFIRSLRCWAGAMMVGLLGCTAVYGQSAAPSVLVLGGASHTQSGFSDPRIQRFYTATAANAAEQMAEALEKAGVRNTKFIVWSKYPEYQQELGNNIAACDCNFLLQVSFGKDVAASPQVLFLEYQLMYLAKSASQQPGFEQAKLEARFKRHFDIPITNDILGEGKFPSFATEIAGEIVKSGALTTNSNSK
ncbi:hypothetical protein [Polaromonas sp. JS666]|uniref:hypothetical protein n=1 Tax=Polaromonas sp. (strain JS666 / ATCC BAA-500) TaxID=296591 RepID=UPI00088D5B75|nr:hypothetical protein [Polaromonas sp. JS666]SDN32994.1 hypothetical protein SAMN05720382_104426 [Polaromonas sp. JS666]